MKPKLCKRWLCLLLALVLTASLLPAMTGRVQAAADPNGTARSVYGIHIDENHFPDPNFLNFVRQKLPHEHLSYFTWEELDRVLQMDCSGLEIGDLSGIEYFPNLRTLNCGNNQLKTLNVHWNGQLEVLNASHNQLHRLDLSGNPRLQELWIQSNPIFTLDVNLNQELRVLQAGETLLTELDLLWTPKLERLLLGDCRLWRLSLTYTTNLRELNVRNNPLERLELGNLPNLTKLNIQGTRLCGLDLSGCQNLNSFEAGGLRRTVPVDISGWELDFDGLDPKKVSNEQGGYVTSMNGKVQNLTFNYGSKSLKYDYDTGNGYTMHCHLYRLLIDEINFPDEAFRKCVERPFPDRDVYYQELTQEVLDQIIVLKCTNKGIRDMSGVEYLTSLDSLICDQNYLPELDLSRNSSLTQLYCRFNQTETLILYPNSSMWKLECQDNHLSSLYLDKFSNLQYLDCSSNHLRELDLSQNNSVKKSLNTLMCSGNFWLKELDLQNLSRLETLDCSNCSLETLDVSKLTELTRLECSGNAIRELDLQKNPSLRRLDVSDNQLMCLDLTAQTGLTSAALSGNNRVIADRVPVSRFPGLQAERMADITGGFLDDDTCIYIRNRTEPFRYRYQCSTAYEMPVTLTLFDPQTHELRIENLDAPVIGTDSDYLANTNIPGLEVEKIAYYVTNQSSGGELMAGYVPQNRDFGFVEVSLRAPENSFNGSFGSVGEAVWNGRKSIDRIYNADMMGQITFRFPFEVQADPSLRVTQIPITVTAPALGEKIRFAECRSSAISIINTLWSPQHEDYKFHPWTAYTVTVQLKARPGYLIDPEEFMSGGMVTINDIPAACSTWIPETGDGFYASLLFEPLKCNGVTLCPSKQFTDVPHPRSSQGWAHEGIDYVVENGLFLGRSETEFAPWDPMDRSMLVTVLWRYAGCPHSSNNFFPDVPPRKDMQWCVEPISWAATNNIVKGYPDGTFGPLKKISRQDLMTILYRYTTEYMGLDTSGRADLSGFPDEDKVFDYARDPISWGVATGLLSGRAIGGKIYLDPQGDASRAQVATIMMRFAKLFTPVG